MATPLDLQEQEQLDELKAFWKQYGNLIVWTLTIVLLAFAGWNGWNWWQRNQATKATALYDELDRVARAGDAERAGRAFADLRDKFPRTLQAQQGALLAAKAQADKGQSDAALSTLGWVSEAAGEDEYRVIARLRAAGLLMAANKHDEALKQLDAAQQSNAREFDALIADRRGDVLAAQGKKSEATAAYQAALKGMESSVDYRRLVEAKLTAQGVAAEAAASAPAGASK
jgi:predicted negative regulator of RcsB-dependent stress response